MKKSVYIATAVGALGLLIFIACNRSDVISGDGSGAGSGFDQSDSLTNQTYDPSKPGQAGAGAGASAQTLPANKIENLRNMVATLATYANPNQTLEQLVGHLKSSGQDPRVAADQQDGLEDMFTVRTQSPLAGTRYFQAQYVEDDHGHGWPVAQMMSFELQPSEASMGLAIDTVKESFSDLGQVLYEEDGRTIQWALPGGYALSVTKLNALDLEDHYMNAYTQADIGTVRVTVEQIPGGH